MVACFVRERGTPEISNIETFLFGWIAEWIQPFALLNESGEKRKMFLLMVVAGGRYSCLGPPE